MHVFLMPTGELIVIDHQQLQKPYVFATMFSLLPMSFYSNDAFFLFSVSSLIFYLAKRYDFPTKRILLFEAGCNQLEESQPLDSYSGGGVGIVVSACFNAFIANARNSNVRLKWRSWLGLLTVANGLMESCAPLRCIGY